MRRFRFKPWMLNGHPGNITIPVKRVIVRGINHGLVVTSTTDGGHATTSFHFVKPKGKAVDMAGPGVEAEIEFQRDLIKHNGAARFNEIFGPDNFANVKNGQRITLVEGSGLEQMHDTHIHVAPRFLPALKLPQSVRDRKLAVRLRRLGARYTLSIIQEARRERVPLSWALALVDQESAFRNIFGGDHGNLPRDDMAPFFRVKVTRERVAELLRWVAKGKASNGVGLTQLTSVGYILEANREGGAHVPKVNLRVGFRTLRRKSGGDFANQSWKYNGRLSYQDEIAAKQVRWRRLLEGP
jgi:hypothetical protein